MSSGPIVTVVIPTHNRRALLLRTLDSVLRQEAAAFAIVIVDDGGSDDTRQALSALSSDQVRLLRHDVSRGVSTARNTGLAVATTPYVAFLDDDDLWAPDKLATQLAALAECPSARWACTGAVHVGSHLEIRWLAHPPPAEVIAAELLERNAVPGGGSGVIVETSLAREVGGFDESISILADWDFYLRLAQRAPAVAVDRPLLAYYVHGDSMYHNPRGVLRELSYLEAKYDRILGPGCFHVDRGRWHLLLSRVARRAGDNFLALQLAVKAVISSPAVVTEGLTRRLGTVATRGGGSPTRHDDYREDVGRWLYRYTEVRIK